VSKKIDVVLKLGFHAFKILAACSADASSTTTWEMMTVGISGIPLIDFQKVL
jgi:hypothetical protein